MDIFCAFFMSRYMCNLISLLLLREIHFVVNEHSLGMDSPIIPPLQSCRFFSSKFLNCILGEKVLRCVSPRYRREGLPYCSDLSTTCCNFPASTQNPTKDTGAIHGVPCRKTTFCSDVRSLSSLLAGGLNPLSFSG